MAGYSTAERIERQEAYRRLAAHAPDMPVFLKPFYLDAVCGPEHWSAALAYRGSQVVGGLPFFLKRKLCWLYVAMPLLCRFMGPYVLPEFRSVRREIPLLRALLCDLPPLAAFEQDFHYMAANWLPFYWAGFRQTTRYSYTATLTDLASLQANLAPDYRNSKLPKAAMRVEVHRGGDLRLFYDVHNRSYARQGLQAPFPFSLLARLDQALAAQHCREVFWAIDRHTGAPHAVAYVVWDEHSAYYLLAGEDPTLRNSGAGILLAWEAMRFALEELRVATFDFLGSMLPAIERVRRQLGAEPRPYFRIQKEWSLLWRIGKRLLR
ncbi:MAG: GNAT family N-acetyltransferase [Saprospiraceae bacterium]|nr:GNAT family N-acetyltransferase [Saprospiraceae bacterium]MDW8484236.1 GNAT family N-acetyltransferase [Saprospiraceae bacterium]